MSLNLGTPAIQAIATIRHTEPWREFMTGFQEVVRQKLHQAIESPAEERIEATAYVRALHDIYIAFEGATKNVNPRQVPKLGTKAMNPLPSGNDSLSELTGNA
jgi:hypothetical protein